MLAAIAAAAAFGAPTRVLLIQGGVMVFVALFVFTRPVPPEAGYPEDETEEDEPVDAADQNRRNRTGR